MVFILTWLHCALGWYSFSPGCNCRRRHTHKRDRDPDRKIDRVMQIYIWQIYRDWEGESRERDAHKRDRNRDRKSRDPDRYTHRNIYRETERKSQRNRACWVPLWCLQVVVNTHPTQPLVASGSLDGTVRWLATSCLSAWSGAWPLLLQGLMDVVVADVAGSNMCCCCYRV